MAARIWSSFGRIGELHVHERAAAEIDAQRNAVPEEHRQNAGRAEDQGEGQEVPLLAQEIDIGVAKKLHFKTLDSNFIWHTPEKPAGRAIR